MIRDGHMGWREATALFTCLLIAKIFLIAPTHLLSTNYTAAWMIPLWSGGISLGLFFLFERAVKGITQTQTPPPWLTFIVGFPLTFAVLAILSVFTREFAETVTLTVLPQTPLIVIVIGFVGAGLFLSYGGIETISRTAWFFFPWLLLGMGIILLFASPKYDFLFIFPLWGPGLPELSLNSLLFTSLYLEVPLFGVYYYAFRDHAAFQKAGYFSILLALLIMVLTVGSFLLIFGVVPGQNNPFAFYQLSRLVSMGRFFQRVEAAFIFVYVTIAVIYISTALSIAAMAYAQAFGFKRYRPLLFPLGMILISLIYYPESLIVAFLLDRWVVERYGGILTIGIPLLLIVVSWIIGRKGKKNGLSP